MIESSFHTKTIPDWDKNAYASLLENNYLNVVKIYEQLVNTEPSQEFHYCYLGLAYLLNQQEDLAQLIWFTLLSECESEHLMAEFLTRILGREAKRQADLDATDTSWLIRQYTKEINPENIENILLLIIDSILINQFKVSNIDELNIIELLSKKYEKSCLDFELIESVSSQLIQFDDPLVLELISCLAKNINDLSKRWSFLMTNASKASKKNTQFAAKISELCAVIKPTDSRTWIAISYFNSKAANYAKAIEAANHGYLNASSAGWKAISFYTLERELMLSGSWIEIEKSISQYKTCLMNLIQQEIEFIDTHESNAIITTSCLLQYCQDNPRENRFIQNKISELYQNQINKLNDKLVKLENIDDLSKSNQKIKLGFIAHTLKAHSVGWLFRWVCKYIDLDRFKVSLFLISQNSEDLFTKKWFISDKIDTLFFGEECLEIVKAIKSKDIQILIDLDSLTLQETCKVLAYKPAPIQITWLGFDATGLPSVDYFFADSYVLPEDAQDYYQERIYRLPQTYIAIDGFEVGTPTLTREDLSIPPEAVVFLTAQAGLKRNPDFIRVQLTILKRVPNSYLLIKGAGDSQKIQTLFYSLAIEVGILPSQLRFLDFDKHEFYHRANMQIADIVLDTYPYNGATTTLEALWMGIPVITRVGEQFSSRNGYSFLTQVGITEGIATTDEEYVQWGVRFGTNEKLRQKVYWQVQSSRQHSPLWQAEKFTRQLECALSKIWSEYLQSLH